MNQATFFAGAVLGVAMFIAPALPAQILAPARSNTNGVNLGVHLNGSAHQFAESDIIESGGGLGARLGWGVTQHVTLYTQLEAATLRSSEGPDEYMLVHIDLGARVNFGSPASAWRPYVGLALSGRGAGQTISGSEVVLAGPAVSGGAGIQYFMTRSLALDLGLGISYGKYTDATVDGESVEIGESDPATSTRVNLGLSWYPGG